MALHHMRHLVREGRGEHRVVRRERVQEASVDKDVLAGQRKRVDLWLQCQSMAPGI